MAGPGKKHILIEVPDHQPLAAANLPASTHYTSFLRLGTPEASPPMKTLLDAIVTDGFIDDDRVRGTGGTQATVAGGSGTQGQGHLLTPAKRAEETARLLSKGGWFDHTSGNRISTTVGDRVDVIRGNYKLVVLGRQDGLDEAADIDFSGGHMIDGGLAPGGIHEIRWVQTWDGTWKVVELTEKGDQHIVAHGNVREERYGDVIERVTGAESDADIPLSQLVPKQKTLKPTITETTFAKSITNSTGSSGYSIPTISDTTYATTIEQKTVATNVTAKTEGSVFVKEYLGTSSTWAEESRSESYVKTVHEETTATSMYSLTKTATKNDLEFTGAKSSIIICGVMSDIEISALRLEVKAGLVFFEIEAGLMYTELCIGFKMELKLAGEMKYTKSDKTAALNKMTAGVQDNKVMLALKNIAATFKAIAPKAAIGLDAP